MSDAEAKPFVELAVVSGKGGTGKTSLAASFAVLAQDVVLADCDVDAADLHLLLHPALRERKAFQSGSEAVIDKERCAGCGICMQVCRFDAVVKRRNGSEVYEIDDTACEGCGVCEYCCPEEAIEMRQADSGELYVSDTRYGRFVHAALKPAAENSGKLVTWVRETARSLAEHDRRRLVLIDGPPGIGCPVIASLTGVSRVLVVSEPTVSGLHDLDRVLSLARHFGVPASVCVNKWDLNPEMTDRIEQATRDAGADIGGRIRYDTGFTLSQIAGVPLVEHGGPAAQDVRAVWDDTRRRIHV
jgi:MinD superfamily P-loop ATPase